jgi:hypothetical protein
VDDHLYKWILDRGGYKKEGSVKLPVDFRSNQHSGEINNEL